MRKPETDVLPPVRYVEGLVPGDPLVPLTPPGLVCAETLSPCFSVLLRVRDIIVAETLKLPGSGCPASPPNTTIPRFAVLSARAPSSASHIIF
jgi:hypothetical protein